MLQVVIIIQKLVAFKNCVPFTKYITEINETFVDDAKHINITIPIHNLIE